MPTPCYLYTSTSAAPSPICTQSQLQSQALFHVRNEIRLNKRGYREQFDGIGHWRPLCIWDQCSKRAKKLSYCKRHYTEQMNQASSMAISIREKADTSNWREMCPYEWHETAKDLCQIDTGENENCEHMCIESFADFVFIRLFYMDDWYVTWMCLLFFLHLWWNETDSEHSIIAHKRRTSRINNGDCSSSRCSMAIERISSRLDLGDQCVSPRLHFLWLMNIWNTARDHVLGSDSG